MMILKLLKNTITISLVILSIACGFVYFLTMTQAGLKMAVYIGEQFLPGQLSIGDVQGSLMTSCKFRLVKYQSPSINFSSQEINLSVHIDKHNYNKVVIDYLVLFNTKVNSISQDTTSNNINIKPLYNLSRYVSLHRLKIMNCQYTDKTRSSFVKIDTLDVQKNEDDEHVFEFTSSIMNAHGKIKFQYEPIFHWQIITDVKNLSLSFYKPSWHGDLSMKLESIGALSDNNIVSKIHINNIFGKINNMPIVGEINIKLDKSKALIEKFFLKVADASLSATGNLDKNSKITWFLKVPNFSHLIPQALGQMVMYGSASGHLDNLNLQANVYLNEFKYFQIKTTKLSGKLFANINHDFQVNIYLLLDHVHAWDYYVKHASTSLLIDFTNHRLSSLFKLNLDSQNQIQAEVFLPKIERFDYHQTFTSRIDINLKKLKPYLHLPHINFQQASLKSLLNLSGNIDDFHINGSGQFLLNNAKLNELGIVVSKLKLDAQNITNHSLGINGHLYTSGRLAQINGECDWKNSPKLHFKFVGDKLPVVQLKKYRATASPDLDFVWQDNILHVSGKLNFPQVKIYAKKMSNIIELPSEIVLVNQKKTNLLMPKIAAKILLTLGDDVDIIYDNLIAKLNGQLQIEENPGGAPIGIGQVIIQSGQYMFYGKKLAIKRGKLIFAGNLITNPGLDIKAIQKVKTVNITSNQHVLLDGKLDSKVYSGTNNIELGILVRGTLKDPEVSLTSDPMMNQEDILSYMLFGHPRSQISEASSLALISALTATQSTGKKILANVDSFKNQLGLSEINVDNTNYYSTKTNQITSAATINLKKKIGKKLSINYSQGIFNSLSILGVRYQINKYFTLQSQSSPIDNGIDILYEYEHD